MSWPLSQDYNEAVQSPARNFTDPDLRTGQAVTNALGIPMPCSGNFADVYQVRCPDGSRWAVKCFTRGAPGLRERYQEISRHLAGVRLGFTVDFAYLEQGIRVAGRWYPVLKMQWVEGLPLNQFVRQYADRPAMLEALLRLWSRMARHLRAAEVGHCDLQHGNVILVPGAGANSLVLRLIDYDGMWVPALADSPPGEVGHAAYQHPQRLREGTYRPEVDRFPLLVVATALAALKRGGRALWHWYDNGDNLLFRQEDFEAPSKSRLFYELLKSDAPAVRLLAENLIEAARHPLEQTPPLEELIPGARSSSAPAVRQAAPAEAETAGTDTAAPAPTVVPFRGDSAPERRRANYLTPLLAAAVPVALLGVLVGAIFLGSGSNPTAPGARATGKPPQPPDRPADLVVGRPKTPLLELTAAQRAEFDRLLSQGKTAMKEKKYDEAVKAFGDAVKIIPGDSNAQGWLQLARDEQSTRDDYARQVGRGKAALDAGKWDDATAAFNEALKLVPDDAEAAKGLQAAKLKQWEAAKQKQFAEFNKQMAAGNAALKDEKWDEASAAFTTALKAVPGDFQATKGLLAANDGKKKHAEAAAADSVKKKLAGTKWLNSVQATFEWGKDGRFFYNGEERDWKAVDARSVQIVFGPDDVDTLVFDESFGEFEQLIAGGPGSFQGNRIPDTPAKPTDPPKPDTPGNGKTQPEPRDAAIARGVAYLKSQQQPDGTWKRKEVVGATALCGLALLEAGVKPDDPAVQKAAESVRSAGITCTHTYSLALGILFLDRLGDPADAELTASMAVRLLAGQDPQSGGWTYECPPPSADEVKRLQAELPKRKEPGAKDPPKPAQARKDFSHLSKEIQKQINQINRAQAAPAKAGHAGDNSNTQFAVLGLWVAARQGIPLDKVATRLLTRFRGTQRADGGWGYTPPASAKDAALPVHNSTPTMTCAGLLGLAVGLGGNPKRAPGAAKDAKVAKGLRSLEPVLAAPEHPERLGGRALYFWWALERVCLIYDVKTVGDKDWHALGTKWLLEHQKPDGSWQAEFAEGGADTCFALLFLARSDLAADLTRQLK
jgi:tetratricopeptide (TPR) repeat protein